MEALEILLLLLAFQVDLLLFILQIFVDPLLFGLLSLNLPVEPLNLGVVLSVFLVQSLLRVSLLLLYLLLLVFDLLDQLVLVVLLDQDLLRRLDGWHALQLLLGDWVVVFNAQTRQHSIKANREELVVVVAQPHALNLLAVDLHLQCLFNEVLAWVSIVAENLDWARPLRL